MTREDDTSVFLRVSNLERKLEEDWEKALRFDLVRILRRIKKRNEMRENDRKNVHHITLNT